MSKKTAFIFPGQGSQYEGMFDLVREYKKAQEFMGIFEDLLHYRFDTLKDTELQQTQITQPALYTMSAIYASLLMEEGVKPDFVAGHSLGEFSSLFCAGSFSFEDGLKIVSIRGKLMKEVSETAAGGMAAIIGLSRETVVDICQHNRQYGIIEAVNFNSPAQIVISGEKLALEKASEEAKHAKARLVVPLSVSAAFHSPLMEPLREHFRNAFKSIVLADANIPVIQNVDAQPHQQKHVILENLISQLHKPVLWQDSVEKLVSLGVNSFVETGPKKVLAGLMKHIPFQVVISEEWIKSKGV